MIYTLDRAGVLKNLHGLMVGQMTKTLDNQESFGKTAPQIIYDIVKQYNYPVCFNMPFGHVAENNPIIIGSEINLCVGASVSEIKYLA